jgi:hypothetical protein
VTITGTGVGSATSVVFGDQPATDLTVIDEGTITVKTPAHPFGTVDVLISFGQGGITLPQAFTFVPGFPNTAGILTGMIKIIGVGGVLAVALFFLARKKQLFARKTA